MLNVVSRAAILLSSLQILAITTACHSPDKHDNADGNQTNIPIAVIPQGFNAALIADSSCMISGANIQLQSASIWAIANGTEQNQQIQLDGNVWGVNSLNSRYVVDTTYGLKAEIPCNGSTDNCTNTLFISDSGSPLRICRADGTYPKNSIESIGLTTFTALHNLMVFHDSVPDHDATILPLHLQIYPTLQMNTGSALYQRQDHLSYYGNFNKQPTVVVLPPSGNTNQILGGVNLWESPWIISHEASHHIFHTYLASSLTTVTSSGAGLLKATAANDLNLRPAAGTTTSNDPYLTLSFTAINEGFADLFAFIALSGDSSYIDGFPCISKTRDINSVLFSNGVGKSLTRSDLNAFFSPDTTLLGPCDVNYHDPHIIGAIAAHAMYGIFFHATKSQGSAVNMAQIALAWVKLIPQVVGTSSSAEDMLRNMLYAGLLAAAEDNQYLNAQQCDVIRTTLPVFADSWIGTNGSLTCR